MRITAKIHEVFNNEKSNVKATASAAFGGQFAVHGFTVMNGRNGLQPIHIWKPVKRRTIFFGG